MTTETTPHVSDEALVQQAITYVNLRQELMERGDVLAQAIMERPGKTLIVADGHRYWELTRNYSPGRYELPVGVAAAEILGLAAIDAGEA